MKAYRLNVEELFNGDDNNPKIAEFIEKFGAVIYPGKGGPSKFLAGLKIEPDFSLQCLVGIPEEEFTKQKKALVEAYCRHIFGINIAKLDAIWTSEREWRPTNPSCTGRDLSDSLLDVDWMTSLGLVRGRWETYVLLCSPSVLSRQDKMPNRDDVFAENARLLLALSVYGFADPWQFFKPNNRR